MEWEGVVPGPDRLRFMGMTSRYVALISNYSLEETGNGRSQ
jgi:ABC-2 type transport system ATP-binding protein